MNKFFLFTYDSKTPRLSSNARILPNRYSFRLVKYASPRSLEARLPAPEAQEAFVEEAVAEEEVPVSTEMAPIEAEPVAAAQIDDSKRNFLKLASVIGVGALAASAIPQKAQAYVMGSSPTSGVVGVKDATNARVNPATEETLQVILEGNSVLKKTISLSSSGAVHTPSSGKKVRLYNTKFSLDATMTSVSFRFASGGTDFEKYLAPRTGGLYGTNNHPNYKEGGVDEAVYCVISGTGNVQINIDYLEV
jgi:hypothetical protein